MFKKLIYNLVLNVHPICTNRFMHPLLTKQIHQFYLNFKTICIEYAYPLLPHITKKNSNATIDQFRDEYDTFEFVIRYNEKNIIIAKWLLRTGIDIHRHGDYLFRIAYSQSPIICKLLIDAGADVNAPAEEEACMLEAYFGE